MNEEMTDTKLSSIWREHFTCHHYETICERRVCSACDFQEQGRNLAKVNRWMVNRLGRWQPRYLGIRSRKFLIQAARMPSQLNQGGLGQQAKERGTYEEARVRLLGRQVTIPCQIRGLQIDSSPLFPRSPCSRQLPTWEHEHMNWNRSISLPKVKDPDRDQIAKGEG